MNQPRHCVITGAAQGIGRALTQRFTKAGFRVTGVDVLESDRCVRCDLSSESEVLALAEKLKTGPAIDVLIHNAGSSHVSPFASSDIERQKTVLRVNLFAPFLLTQELLPSLPPASQLVFISSLSHFVGYPGASVYAASKDGLAEYAQSLRESGREVLTVFPGPTRTEHARRYSPDNRKEHRRMAPEALAEKIFVAIEKRKPILIPGTGNRVMAFLGRWFPWLTEWILCRAILNKLT